MGTRRSEHTLNTIKDGKLIVTGGISGYVGGEAALLNSVEIHTNENGWETKSWTLPYPDAKHCVLSRYSSRYVTFISGVGSPNEMQVWRISIETGRKFPVDGPVNSEGGAHYCASTLYNIYVSEQQGNGRQHKIWKFNSLDEVWTPLAMVYDTEHQGLA